MPNQPDPQDRQPEFQQVDDTGGPWGSGELPQPEGTGVDATDPPRCCIRCMKPITNTEREVFFAATGLCFWCAYVDAQG